MNKSTTKIAFLWHMHQPYYKYPDSKEYCLPWVRFHAVKDYYGMAKTVAKFSKVKVAFNFSGVLLEQLSDYVNNRAKDYYLTLSLKDPAHLKKEEKDFILNRFFSVNFERVVKLNKRYLQLYNKKVSPKSKFNSQDIADLQFLFNVSWFHPYTLKSDKELKRLISKGRDYTRSDIEYVINKQYQVMDEIFPLYSKLAADGRIELTLTPFYHPIMPMLCDSDVIKEFSYLKKPVSRFMHPEDCLWHLEKSKEIFKNNFNHVPRGSWPSEGSVSETVLTLYGKEGFEWIGADEAILFKSLMTDYVSYDMIKNQRHIIYRPYKFRDVNIFFRDRNFSDMLSFIYQGWDDANFAVNDLMEHFRRTHEFAKNIYKERVISIIMDGENAWEYYKNNGVDFLETLYSSLEKSDCISSTTPSEFLKNETPRRLERLSSGSWINGDFGVWAGSKKNNYYWSILKKTRDLIEKSKLGGEAFEELKKYFYLIEGSDWFWWNTFEDFSGEFKKIFFAYVNKIYRLLGKKAPEPVK